MGKEIERKFLVAGCNWKRGESAILRQGYLNAVKERTVRVRATAEKAQLTIKGVTQGATRAEYEDDIPLHDAKEILDNLCERPLIEKRRYVIEHAGVTWEADEFFGENDGLVLAEVELESEGQAFDKPPWLGEEVTHDPRFFNANLVVHPYSTWKDKPA